VLVVLLVAEVSRRWVAGTSQGSRRLGLSVSIETAVVVVVLAVTSLLVSGVPARSDYRPSTDMQMAAGPVRLELAVDPMATRVVDVRVDTTDAEGNALDVDEMTLTLTLPSPAAGPLNVRLDAIGNTQFQASDVELPYTGRWTFALVARTSETQEWTGRTSIDVR
jgi:nitrogen fixation protein FixH